MLVSSAPIHNDLQNKRPIRHAMEQPGCQATRQVERSGVTGKRSRSVKVKQKCREMEITLHSCRSRAGPGPGHGGREGGPGARQALAVTLAFQADIIRCICPAMSIRAAALVTSWTRRLVARNVTEMNVRVGVLTVM